MKRFAILVVAGTALAAGVAYATIPDSSNVFTACMLKSVGTIRLIDPALPSTNLMSHCTSLETKISWNQKGSQGDRGIQGVQGPQGPAGADGKDGAPGKDGTSCVNADGTLASPSCRGPQGPQGPQGPAGSGLVGSACSIPGGGNGTVQMDVASGGAISFTCSVSSGGGGGGTNECPSPLPSYPNAVTTCDPTTGLVGLTCSAGFADTNGVVSDGCETSLGGETNANLVDSCTLESPTTLNIATGGSTPQLSGRIFQQGVTETAGASSTVLAQVGYGPAASDPRSSAGWTFVAAGFNVQVGNDDEYRGSFQTPAPGVYSYTYRFSVDAGAHFTFCDTDGAGANPGLTFSPSSLGLLTVTP
jgi:hypothetical protein